MSNFQHIYISKPDIFFQPTQQNVINFYKKNETHQIWWNKVLGMENPNCAILFFNMNILNVQDILQNKSIMVKPLSVFLILLWYFFFMLGVFICAATLLNESPGCCWITPAQRPFDWLSLTILENVCLDGGSNAEGTLRWRSLTHKLQALAHTSTLTVCNLLSLSHFCLLTSR